MLSESLSPWIPRAVVDYVRQLLPKNPRHLDLGYGNGDVTAKMANAVGA